MDRLFNRKKTQATPVQTAIESESSHKLASDSSFDNKKNPKKLTRMSSLLSVGILSKIKDQNTIRNRSFTIDGKPKT